ncbi:Major phosphate-irrepressible acid phosphatase precursor [compost metagenome]
MHSKIRSKAASVSLVLIGMTHAMSYAADKTADSAVTDPHFQLAPGYIPKESLPNSLDLLGPPPAPASAAYARDEEARNATIPLRGSARASQARLDADLQFPQPARNFSCAMGIDITETQTPHLYRLMQKVLTDAGLSTYGVKNTYNRVRPFVVHNEGTCFPEQESLLRTDGSYPSGHTAAGWAWALILAEINPDRANTLFKRGLEFGQSRVICNAHWQSDVDAGRTMGAATVALLQNYAEFRADLDAARKEVLAAKAKIPAPAMDCSAEVAAFSK